MHQNGAALDSDIIQLTVAAQSI